MKVIVLIVLNLSLVGLFIFVFTRQRLLTYHQDRYLWLTWLAVFLVGPPGHRGVVFESGAPAADVPRIRIYYTVYDQGASALGVRLTPKRLRWQSRRKKRISPKPSSLPTPIPLQS